MVRIVNEAKTISCVCGSPVLSVCMCVCETIVRDVMSAYISDYQCRATRPLIQTEPVIYSFAVFSTT